MSHSDTLRVATWGVAAVTAAAAASLDAARLLSSARADAGPFLSLAAIIALGGLLDRIGVFRVVGRALVPHGRGEAVAVLSVVALTALVSGVLNLDVGVVVATPVAMLVARRVELDAATLAATVAVTANATSFLLPTSNVTTLLALNRSAATSPEGFLGRSWAAWLLVALVTAGGAAILTCRRSGPPPAAIAPRTPFSALGDLPPLYVGASAVQTLGAGGLAVHGAFPLRVAAVSAISAGMNNLPAAASIHASGGPGTWATVLGLAIGPNLLLTGSLATLICRRLARDAGAGFSWRTFARVGVALVPVQLAAAWVGLRLSGALR